jgi:hypothetical protein
VEEEKEEDKDNGDDVFAGYDIIGMDDCLIKFKTYGLARLISETYISELNESF